MRKRNSIAEQGVDKLLIQRQYVILTMDPFPYFHPGISFSLSFAHNDLAGGPVIVPSSA